MAEERGLTVDKAAYEAALAEAREKSRAGGKKAAGAGLKFEAEATGWLQAHAVPLTVGGWLVMMTSHSKRCFCFCVGRSHTRMRVVCGCRWGGGRRGAGAAKATQDALK